VDLLVFGIALNIFALGNSSMLRPATGGEDLPQPTAITQPPSPSPTQTNSQTGTQAPTTTALEQPTPVPQDQGMWGGKFGDKFSGGDVTVTDYSYKSKNINITISNDQSSGYDWYIADVYIRNKDNFQAFFLNDHFGGIDSTLDQAKTRTAIFAVNGDNGANRPNRLGYEIRNGKLYHSVAWQDVLAMYNDGSMKVFNQSAFEPEFQSIKATGGSNGGIWQVWSFGPMLLDANGQPMAQFAPDSIVGSGNERTAIGYYEPGHYCFITVGSSDPSNRAGPSLADLSQKFYNLGCKIAYNLDGGQSSEMVFNGKFVNAPYHGGRSVSDIVAIGDFGS
jgi:exopolysaccharide biosynthesis protein